jgi:tRNA pseudouridine38-40 synthase
MKPLMHKAAQLFVGETILPGFRALHCQSKTPFRNVHQVNVTRQGMYVMVDIRQCIFLQIIWCVILLVHYQTGLGNQPIEWIPEIVCTKKIVS